MIETDKSDDIKESKKKKKKKDKSKGTKLYNRIKVKPVIYERKCPVCGEPIQETYGNGVYTYSCPKDESHYLKDSKEKIDLLQLVFEDKENGRFYEPMINPNKIVGIPCVLTHEKDNN